MMDLLRGSKHKPVRLQLKRDLIRAIKRGHCWVYQDALRELPVTPPGISAILYDNRGGREIGRGYYDPNGVIALRVCTTLRGEHLDDTWAAARMQRAVDLRRGLFNQNTTAYRLFNGEEDGLPGLVCDCYADVAVLSFDGQAAHWFWNAEGIACWLVEKLGLLTVYTRNRVDPVSDRQLITGPGIGSTVQFLENGIQFTADLLHGQKTGFYLDQRENRRRMEKFTAGKDVLNLFGYTGGFSVYAGMAGAGHVTTVDSARLALISAEKHWELNNLDLDKHSTVCGDVFRYLEAAINENKFWDVVILDPPSFASSKETVQRAVSAYKTLISMGAGVTKNAGVLAASSCSSHINSQMFLGLCQEGLSKARRQGQVLEVHTQPADHPVPLAMPEFRYLKFIIIRIAT